MKLPKGGGAPVLYLDFDGVLHHHDVRWRKKGGAYLEPAGFTLFEHAQLLEDWLRPYPQVRIVLATSWVVRYHCYRAARRLPEALRARVIGGTYHSHVAGADEDERQAYGGRRRNPRVDAFCAKPRGVQVAEDAQRRKPSAWFALDDDDENWPASSRSCLVKTDPALGLSAPDIAGKVAEHLQRICAQR